MNVSFIITTYNIASYIERCLVSVLDVARPGDEVIVVDDGSKDETASIVKELLFSARHPEGVEVKPVFLGSNTMGGVGIAGNIGMDMATRECVFFVDGDDWLDVEGFNIARDAFAQADCDILLANYLEFDEAQDVLKAPADEWRWLQLSGSDRLADQQLDAVKLIAVPWRKFYRRAFLNQNKLRFPEGDFFFEDNPFHWEVCLKAQSIHFLDVTLCYHRVNRPGQTMASTGVELIAFLDHFSTIKSHLTAETPAVFHEQALTWLLGNMSWHLGRLQPKAAPFYFRRAEAVFKELGQGVATTGLPEEFQGTEIALYTMLLEERGWGAALEVFLMEFNRKRLMTAERALNNSINRSRSELLGHVKPIRNAVTSLRNIAEYELYHAEHSGASS